MEAPKEPSQPPLPEMDEKRDISKEDNPVLHVIVVGFHHKKGCLVNYSYPPLLPDGDGHSSELPSQWKHLPSLALPDGSHNYESDTAFFHLPDLVDPRKTIFGISCYRQIEASQVKNPTEDVTRGSVQKSVCVLSRLPLYGHIQVKMALITEAFFREGDFSRLDLIHQTYDNLSACLTNDLVSTQQLYVGLSARKLVQTLCQRTLVLFKLFLLEKKVLFFQSPVLDLCTYFLTLLSLHPGMLEEGLKESACSVPLDTPPDSLSPEVEDRPISSCGSVKSLKSNVNEANEEFEDDPTAELQRLPSLTQTGSVANEEVGLPLRIFGRGNLCHPYLSLSYIDALSQPCVRGYIIGATNALFKQKSGVAEVIIDIEKDKIDILEPELKKALQLTTEDLRFIDFIIKQVSIENGSDIFLDGVGWEGGDEWIRAQFRMYILCLLRTVLNSDQDQTSTYELHRFNPSFVQMWKKTMNYRLWREHVSNETTDIESFVSLPPLHPCSGQLSINDMRLHLSNTMGSTESGKKVTQALGNTGRAVAGGISSAKGVFSSWMTSFKSDKKEDSNDQKDDSNDQQEDSNGQKDDSNDQKDDSNDAKIDDSTTANDTTTKDDKKQNDNNETCEATTDESNTKAES